MKTTLDTSTPLPVVAPASPKDAEQLQVMVLVQQFEGMLLTEMLRDVRAGDEDDGDIGLGGSTMTDMMQGEFGMALSRSGGLGLGQMLSQALLRRPTGNDLDPATGVTASPLSSPLVVPAPVMPPPSLVVPAGEPGADLVSGAARVTSEFGWRADPFTGETKFHRGVDLAAAYGSDVRAFGPGVVTSAADRPGYGLTVVVDHGLGRETLYAHLSALDVAPGDPVSAGQRIARSGNSGRATGAHLHFEAREYGRPVDGRRLAAAWSGRSADTDVGGPDDTGPAY